MEHEAIKGFFGKQYKENVTVDSFKHFGEPMVLRIIEEVFDILLCPLSPNIRHPTTRVGL